MAVIAAIETDRLAAQIYRAAMRVGYDMPERDKEVVRAVVAEIASEVASHMFARMGGQFDTGRFRDLCRPPL